jgi:hypothetical protein
MAAGLLHQQQDLVELVMRNGNGVQPEQHVRDEGTGTGHARQCRLLVGTVDEKGCQQQNRANYNPY